MDKLSKKTNIILLLAFILIVSLFVNVILISGNQIEINNQQKLLSLRKIIVSNIGIQIVNL